MNCIYTHTFVATLMVLLKQSGIILLLAAVVWSLPVHAQKKLKHVPVMGQQKNEKKMRVDIWSDVMCPFCYIGKRHFEKALEQFEHGKDIEVVWHSFQLDPETTAQPGKDVYTYLAERKGQSLEWSKQAHQHVAQMAANAGLTYNFDEAIIANSFDAHRVLQMAKKYSKGDAMEEQLFKAYFTDGKNIADHNVLAELAANTGLDKEEVLSVLNSDAYTAEVQADVEAAARLRINGVPFFVVNSKYGVSGAQPSETFVQALNKAWAEYEQEHGSLTMTGGDAEACEPGGDCK